MFGQARTRLGEVMPAHTSGARERVADIIARPSHPSARVTVVIPTLNEAANLPHVFAALPSRELFEVIVVDGHSTDDTVAVARTLSPSVRVVFQCGLTGAVAHDDGLTGRESQVLGMVRRGHTTAAIADRLEIAPVTVRRHISELVHKLGVEDRSALTGPVALNGNPMTARYSIVKSGNSAIRPRCAPLEGSEERRRG